ncbi:GvpL/GvpF family gas vesicle protein [Halobacteria archaeon AArc-curdl1]|uniref:GvpL/GvpF family gas vesicle protein n=1 Tax=Natronosalvus hydrolyticus TaxID=2979988 RepID=A0AAP2ZAE6_9EURY|nr:GvpL/GvpF family gas vesicle protein [Halobacteria archaeon AArc-curdl1]
MTRERSSLENEAVNGTQRSSDGRESSQFESHRRESTETTAFDEGRYIYCVVDVEAGEELEATGIDDEPVRVITTDGIGAVVHDCDDVYDSNDHTEIHRWLLRHQSVTDEAAEAFGTPLPFQFATIFRGNDEVVCEWLKAERDNLEDALDSLAGHWEYRIEIVRTELIDAQALESDDDRLAELRAEIESATPGRKFLLESKYDDRLGRIRSDRNESIIHDVRERLETHAREVHELDPSPDTRLQTDAKRSKEGRPIGRLTVLAREDLQSDIGSVLDDVAGKPGLEVTFTGPWPPYSFTPSFGEGTNDSTEG